MFSNIAISSLSPSALQAQHTEENWSQRFGSFKVLFEASETGKPIIPFSLKQD
jgi:hypothetical protein